MRYYFNVRTEAGLLKDNIGSDYPSAVWAEIEAEIAASKFVADALTKGEMIDGQTFEVTDETGALVFTYPFRDVLR